MNALIRVGTAYSLAFLVASCSPDHKPADLGRCVADAKREAPDGSGLNKEEIRDAMGATVVDCMKRAGYRHDMADGRCIDDVDFNPYCYVHKR